MKTKKEQLKLEAGGRKRLLHESMKARFISPVERLARCESAAQTMGYKSIFSLALDHGISHQSMKSSLNSPKMTLVRMEELCEMLQCSVSYLTEDRIEGLR